MIIKDVKHLFVIKYRSYIIMCLINDMKNALHLSVLYNGCMVYII